jgi:hypothetical protein
LFDLYVLATNNSAAASKTATPRTTPVESARALARRALAGELGAKTRELEPIS